MSKPILYRYASTSCSPLWQGVSRPAWLQIVAALAASSLVFADINPAYSANLLGQAASLYAEITVPANMGRYSDVELTGCRLATDPISVSHPVSPFQPFSAGRHDTASLGSATAPLQFR